MNDGRMRTVPDIPGPAVQAAAEVLLRQFASEFESGAGPLTWRDFADEAREVLGAAAPILAEHVAQKITDHMDAKEPKSRDLIGGSPAWNQRRRTWRRHFGIAARVAAGAFSTREDELRMAAEALNRGDFMACPALEDGDHGG